MPEQLEQPQRESVEQAPQQDGAEKPKLDIKPDDLKEAQSVRSSNGLPVLTTLRKKFGDAFKRMRDNMSFASGLQWAGQNTIEDDRYVANMTIRTINQKVAILYARDPKSVARRRRGLTSKYGMPSRVAPTSHGWHDDEPIRHRISGSNDGLRPRKTMGSNA